MEPKRLQAMEIDVYLLFRLDVLLVGRGVPQSVREYVKKQGDYLVADEISASIDTPEVQRFLDIRLQDYGKMYRDMLKSKQLEFTLAKPCRSTISNCRRDLPT